MKQSKHTQATNLQTMPEPSRLILFDQLPSTGQGTKVRFLAWYFAFNPQLYRSCLIDCSVHSYDPKTAQVKLQDRRASSNRSFRSAIANIDNILENVSHEVLEVGAWINVVGTIRKHERVRGETKPSQNSKRSSRKAFRVVDATMIWSAGAVKLEEYRDAVAAYQRTLTLG